MRKLLTFSLVLLAVLADDACAAGLRRRVAAPAVRPANAATLLIDDDFRSGDHAWQPLFFDYSPRSSGMDLDARIAPLPAELGIAGTGMRVNGNNHSDDLFMLLLKKLTAANGVVPNQRYMISYRIAFASNAGSGCGGIGGSPGESVTLKAGASGVEPRIALDLIGQYRINLDVGGQLHGGRDMSTVSSIANGSALCSGNAPYVTLTRSHAHPDVVTASTNGELWLLVGTDSGYEGITTLYYESISATLTPVP
jgi:hypothetical protein